MRWSRALDPRAAITAIAAAVVLTAVVVSGWALVAPHAEGNAASTSSGSVARAPRVGLQIGHWRNTELPGELARLRVEGAGAIANGVAEWEVNLSIAELAAESLRRRGVTVDLIPATVPPGYTADAFLSIHADGNPDETASGYKVAPARRDTTGAAGQLSELVGREYAVVTGLQRDPNVTENMRDYYAFNRDRFVHAIGGETPGAILETGFLTSPRDHAIIVDSPSLAAQGIAKGVERFLRARGLLTT